MTKISIPLAALVFLAASFALAPVRASGATGTAGAAVHGARSVR